MWNFFTNLFKKKEENYIFIDGQRRKGKEKIKTDRPLIIYGDFTGEVFSTSSIEIVGDIKGTVKSKGTCTVKGNLYLEGLENCGELIITGKRQE